MTTKNNEQDPSEPEEVLSAEVLAEIETCRANTTPGTWIAEPEAVRHEYGLFYWQLPREVSELHNTTFIVKAHNTYIPRLLASHRALQRQLEEVQRDLERSFRERDSWLPLTDWCYDTWPPEEVESPSGMPLQEWYKQRIEQAVEGEKAERARVERLISALQSYAELEKYFAPGYPGNSTLALAHSEIAKDSGSLARTTLREVRAHEGNGQGQSVLVAEAQATPAASGGEGEEEG